MVIRGCECTKKTLKWYDKRNQKEGKRIHVKFPGFSEIKKIELGMHDGVWYPQSPRT